MTKVNAFARDATMMEAPAPETPFAAGDLANVTLPNSWKNPAAPTVVAQPVPAGDNGGVFHRFFRAKAQAPSSPAGPGPSAGVYRGYHIVCSAYPVNDRFAGRAGIYARLPQPGLQPLEQVASGATYDSAERAMLAAAQRARHVVDGLSPNWTPFTHPA